MEISEAGRHLQRKKQQSSGLCIANYDPFFPKKLANYWTLVTYKNLQYILRICTSAESWNQVIAWDRSAFKKIPEAESKLSWRCSFNPSK